MKSIVFKNIVLALFSFVFVACSVLQNGYWNEYGNYVPKRPKYKLKDKQGVFLSELDTVNIYRMVEMYNGGKLIYPKISLTNEERYSFVKEINEVNIYIKFFSNGRCLKLSESKWDEFDIIKKMDRNDLNPNNKRNNRSYYYSPDGKNLQIESFVYGDGQGHYVISNYLLSDSGNTLIMHDKYLQIVYRRELMTLNWKQYNLDW